MFQFLLDLINSDFVGSLLGSVVTGTMAIPVSEKLNKLFKKKQEVKVLTIDDCKNIGIKEEDIKSLILEIKQLKKKISINQINEYADNNFTNTLRDVNSMEITQKNIMGDNNIVL